MKFKIYSPKYGEIITLIDKCDLKLIKKYTLRVFKCQHLFYIRGRKKGDKTETTIGLHNIILKYKYVDHINGNGLDNRRKNLRKSNSSMNNKNAKKRKDYKYSKYKGVSFLSKHDRWIARIQCNKKRITIGYYKTEIEAAKAYNQKSIELHKSYGRLNELT
jgi:hypothetical protein